MLGLVKMQGRIQSILFVTQAEVCNVEYRVDCLSQRQVKNPKTKLIDEVEHKL
jgi:hypothetical protein